MFVVRRGAVVAASRCLGAALPAGVEGPDGRRANVPDGVISRECESCETYGTEGVFSQRATRRLRSAQRGPERPPRPAARPWRPWHRKNPRGGGSLPSVPFGIVRGC